MAAPWWTLRYLHPTRQPNAMIPHPPDPMRLLLDALPPAPIEIAGGLSIVEHDMTARPNAQGQTEITGSLVVQLWGRKLTLQSVASGVFEVSTATQIVSFGALGSFVLTRLRLNLQTAPEGTTSFAVAGHGQLEMRGLAGLGAKSWVVDGDLHAVSSAATGDTYLRLDAQPSPVSLAFAGGVVVSLAPERLFFYAHDSGTVDLEMRVKCGLSGLPDFLQGPLGGDPISAEIRFSEQGLLLFVPSLYEHKRIVLPQLDALGHLPAVDLGEAGISASKLRIELGSELRCSVDVTVHVPHVFNAFAESSFSFRVDANGTDVELRLLSSPLRIVQVEQVPRGPLQANIDLGRYGAVSFCMPVMRIDWAQQRLVAEGTFSYRDLRIPLAPVISLLKMAGVQPGLVDRLPESIVLQRFGLTGLAAVLTDLLGQAHSHNVVAEKAREHLTTLVERLDLLPKQLTDSYLHLEIPAELSFRVEVSADLSASLHLSPPPSIKLEGVPQEREVSPIRLLVPVLGPKGPELLGLSLYHLAVHQTQLGQLCTVEIDADMHRFELLSMALSMTLAKEGLFSPPDQLEEHLACRNMLALLVFPGGAPVLLPLFVDKLSVSHVGLDGLGFGATWSFPAPLGNSPSLLKLLGGMGDLEKVGPGTIGHVLPPHVRFVLGAGPFWLRLPNYLGGKRVEARAATYELATPEAWANFVFALRKLDVDGLLETLAHSQDGRTIELDLGPSFRKASRLWAAVAEPALFVSAMMHGDASSEAATPPRKEGMADKLRMLKGRLADGLSALGGDNQEIRVHARLVRVNSTGIELAITLPNQTGGAATERRVHLRWSNFLGSAAGLAAEVGRT